MNYTYRDLLDDLQVASKTQLDCTVTLEFDDEYFPACLGTSGDESGDVLDPGHPVIFRADHMVDKDKTPEEFAQAAQLCSGQHMVEELFAQAMQQAITSMKAQA